MQRAIDETLACVQQRQIFGKPLMAMQNTHAIARLYADTRVGRIDGGSNEVMKELIARAMDRPVGPGKR